MGYLLLGLVVFVGVHSLRIVGEGPRTQLIQQWGAMRFKGIYSLVSVAGFALLVWGFGVARETPAVLWTPPVGMRHAASLLTLIAFILLAAAYVPGNSIKARLHHPMVLGVKTWALAHLLANGMLHQVVLFGVLLVWAVLSFRAARQRDRSGQVQYPAGTLLPTVITVGVGVAAWGVFAFWLHGMLIGIRPFG